MMVYWDASAVVSLWIREPATPRATQAWRDTSTPITSWLTGAEVLSALTMAERLGRITIAQVSHGAQQFDEWFAGCIRVPVSARHYPAVKAVLKSTCLRGADATHLAAAHWMQRHYAGHGAAGVDGMGFATNDRALAEAAVASGLHLMWLPSPQGGSHDKGTAIV